VKSKRVRPPSQSEAQFEREGLAPAPSATLAQRIQPSSEAYRSVEQGTAIRPVAQAGQDPVDPSFQPMPVTQQSRVRTAALPPMPRKASVPGVEAPQYERPELVKERQAEDMAMMMKSKRAFPLERPDRLLDAADGPYETSSEPVVYGEEPIEDDPMFELPFLEEQQVADPWDTLMSGGGGGGGTWTGPSLPSGGAPVATPNGNGQVPNGNGPVPNGNGPPAQVQNGNGGNRTSLYLAIGGVALATGYLWWQSSKGK